MKANNKTEDPDVKDVQTQEILEEGESLLKPIQVKKLFIEIDTKIKHFEQYAAKIAVETDDSLVIAENNISELNEILRNIEKVRKLRKDPYYKASKMIDEFAKTLSKPLEEVKSAIGSAITNYKKIQAAAAKIEAEKVAKEAEKKAKEKNEESDRIIRIRSQLTARIYGGNWNDKTGQAKTSRGCLKSADCEILSTIIDKNIPKPDEFIHYRESYEQMVQDVKNLLAEHKANLLLTESESEESREDAMAGIMTARTKAESDSAKTSEEMKKKIDAETEKEIKGSEKEIKEARKGIRKNIKFDVYDFAKVPRKFLTLDETAVREWIKANDEIVKQKLEDGEVIIDGMNVFYEDSYVSR